MRIEHKIAGMCLFGFICRESRSNQWECIREIERNYGNEIARFVKGLIRRK